MMYTVVLGTITLTQVASCCMYYAGSKDVDVVSEQREAGLYCVCKMVIFGKIVNSLLVKIYDFCLNAQQVCADC